MSVPQLFNAAQQAVVNQDAPNQSNNNQGVPPLATTLNSLYQYAKSGPTGIASYAWDIDSLALNGKTFSIDPVNTTGLTLYLDGAVFHNGYSEVTVAAAAYTLSASTTNYVELDRNGTIYVNTTAFTTGRMPLYQIVTGASAIATTTNCKALLTLLGPASVPGAMLTTAGATKYEQLVIGGVAATTTFLAVAPVTGAVSGITLVNSTAISTDNTNYWQWSAVNLGPANAGTQQLLNTGAVNSTKTAGGSALAANTPASLTLTTLSIGTELNVNAGDVIAITLTKNASATALTQVTVRLDIKTAN